jgi:hypothetical protein
MGEAKRRRELGPANHTIGSLTGITQLPNASGIPFNYRPQCVALYLGLQKLGAEKKAGFFVNVDSDSLEAFWERWPALCLQNAAATGVCGNASVATASMLQAGLSVGRYKNSAEVRAMMAQTAIWFFMANHATPDERDLMLRGDVFIQLTLEETSPALFDTHASFLDLRAPAQQAQITQ